MPHFRLRRVALAAMLAVSLSHFACGCGYLGIGAKSDADLAGLDDEDDVPTAESGDEPQEGELGLKLAAGDRFPLAKRVEQKLTQLENRGNSISRSNAEMLLTLIVDEVRKDGHKKLSVQYHKVNYSQDIGGRRVEYSSENKGQTVPLEALAYAGLVDNSFSFWLGPDNRVIELEGFNEFLQRCLQNVPSQHRAVVMEQVKATHSVDGLSNFVDDGIGLLPYSDDPSHPLVAVRVGSSWETKARKSEGPISVQFAPKCVLKDLTDDSADISLIGKFPGAESPTVVNEGAQRMKLFLKGGHCSGTCKIDRMSGLPIQSRINRYLEMTIELADGTEIQQRKDTLSTISAFTDQGTWAANKSKQQDSNRRPSDKTARQVSHSSRDDSGGSRRSVRTANVQEEEEEEPEVPAPRSRRSSSGTR